MSTMSGILGIARSAMSAQQAAIEVAGHNIANANTAGYTRQSLLTTAADPSRTPMGIFGTGVKVVNVTGQRNQLLSDEVRAQSAPAAAFGQKATTLTRVESIFGEPSDAGLANALDQFWNSWSDLASNPTSAGAKTVVQQRGAALAATFNQYSSQLATLRTSTVSELAAAVTHVGSLASQIASLNGQIVSAESGGQSANDLRDERDRLTDTLGTLLPIAVNETSDGASHVTLNGMPLIDGTTSRGLTLGSGTPVTIRIAGDTDALRGLTGKVGAYIDVLNNDLTAAESDLDAIASAVIYDVNGAHFTGWSPPSGSAGVWPPSGGTGSQIYFFDPTPGNVNARNIRLSASVAANADAVAAGDTLNAPGNNAIALKIAALRDAAPSAPGGSIGGAYRTLVAKVASTKASATDAASVAQTLTDQASARRQSAAGVNTDEELVALMKHQQAYAAAAKVIQAVDQMMQSLLQIG
jgi:flagellar hook-associated protein 1 FlgK